MQRLLVRGGWRAGAGRWQEEAAATAAIEIQYFRVPTPSLEQTSGSRQCGSALNTDRPTLSLMVLACLDSLELLTGVDADRAPLVHVATLVSRASRSEN